MGLFLQKVNINCDYLEDYADSRSWWPQSIGSNIVLQENWDVSLIKTILKFVSNLCDVGMV
jgi:phytoene/squalene synthetase